VRTAAGVGRKVWTAAELEKMTPAEQDDIFKSSIVTDPDEVPAEFFGRIRARWRHASRADLVQSRSDQTADGSRHRPRLRGHRSSVPV